MDLYNINCTLCYSDKKELFCKLKKYSTENSLAYCPEIYVSVCKECGNIFQSPCLSQKEMQVIYATKEDKITGNTVDSVTIKENTKRMLDIASWVSPGANILDIGCGEGSFLARANDAGYVVTGVEPSKANIIKGKKIFPGLNIIRGFFEEIRFDKTFDLICHHFCLEHCYDPRLYLNKINSLLVENGIMIFEVPNIDVFCRLPFAISLFPYQHLSHFYPATIKNLMETSGFKIIKINKELGDSSKSYGMRIYAKKTLNEKYTPTNYYPTSMNILDNYFSKQKTNKKIVEKRVTKFIRGFNNPTIAIFGAGENGQLVLLNTPITKMARSLFFVDNKKEIHGKTINGIKVHHPDYLTKNPCDGVICSSIDYQHDMKLQCVSMGIPEGKILLLYDFNFI